ncbi:hypothetical protein L484_008547 [Morus notabilis]|uniref:Cyanobacterial aminoacyl-tRNA synthetase CAAD domain-containing protein n=1 Tax=Morus notabilis TaxID=981085 RepID=W9SKX7_9ROSA|nr:protein CURVATURE THYLAKOID 1D, chloroplastic [Morus notabilis]EXC14628.1 hypothetical protein L484_008547 [Morus notabilis]
MELCTSQSMSKLPIPNHHPSRLLISNPNHLHCKSSLNPLRRNSLFSPAARGLHYRLIYSPKCLPRATSEETSSGSNKYTSEASSEETLGGANQYTSEKRDSVITFEDFPPVEKKVDNDILTTEVTQEKTEQSPVDEGQSLISEVLDKLNIDSEDTYSILLYGGGASIVLWLASAIVGAIDSIPVIPKFLEIVGLGYTVWFTYRYLIFKKSREELLAKFEELKEEVLGSNDD